jgi:hypothetical protein
MKQMRFNLKLDQEETSKMATYYLYRSEEQEGLRPIVDGVYIQRGTLGAEPPNAMSLVLEWDS